MQSHRHSFFGQKTGMVLSSHDWAEPWVTLTFIKKREEGPSSRWEKFSEGKTLKISLVEIAAILAVARGEKPFFKTYHKFNGDGTPIEVRYENPRGRDDAESVVFSAGDYIRPISWSELEVLCALLKHIFAEKIQHATNSTRGASTPANFICQKHPLESIGGDPATSDDFTLNQKENAPAARDIADSVKGEIFDLPSERILSGVNNNDATARDVQVDTSMSVLLAPNTSLAHPMDSIEIPNSVSSSPPLRNTYIPDGIFARATAVIRVTPKAICLANNTGSRLWIPKTAFIDGSAPPEGPLAELWDFSLRGWFAKKLEVQEWLLGH